MKPAASVLLSAWVALAWLCGAAGAVESATPMSALKCLRIGHRGAASLAPENTLAAVRAAAAAGVDGIEFDVRRTADGLPIVIHDDNLKRTTNGGDRLVSSASLEELRALDAGSWGAWKRDGRFAGEKLPLLDEMIAEILRLHAFPVVELKVGGLEEAVADCLSRHQAVQDAWIISFQYRVLEVFADRYPQFRLAWLVDRKNFEEMGLAGVVRSATLIKCKALNAHFEAITPELVKAVHEAGMLMLAWTVDRPADMQRLLRMGVDGITTNRPQDLNAVLNP
ncbi:hypothetical protein HS125_01515 [bacterium]|nr:hypothetical protein [bacterium]